MSSQLERRVEAIEELGREDLNFRTMHEIKRTMLELEEFLEYDCEHLRNSGFFKELVSCLEMRQDNGVLRLLGNQVKKIGMRVIGEEWKGEEATGGELERLKNILIFY